MKKKSDCYAHPPNPACLGLSSFVIPRKDGNNKREKGNQTSDIDLFFSKVHNGKP